MDKELQEAITAQSNAEASKFLPNESLPVTTLDLDKLTKTIAFVVGFSYAIGILATNTYLYSLGISDFSLLEARYVYTGFLALFPIIISVLLPAFGVHYFRFPIFAASRSSRPNWQILIFCLVVPFLMFFLFSRQGGASTIYSIWQALWMYFLCLSMGMFGTMAAASLLPETAANRLIEIVLPWLSQNKSAKKSKPKPSIKNLPPTLIVAFVAALFTIGYFAFYLSLFGAHILTKVPVQFGGAEPYRAQLLFKSDAVDGARELGIEIPTDKTVSEELTVLFDGEGIIVVRLADENIIQISKEMVRALEIEVTGD